MLVAARPTFISALAYRDPRTAIDWLQKAFSFEIDMLIEDEQGNLAHSELRFGDGLIMVGNEWMANIKSPANVGGKCTQTVHVRIERDIDAHCEHARAAGAKIIADPETQFYGDRTYRAEDPEGHIWTFGQTVKTLSPEEWDSASGLKTTFPAASR